MTAGARGRFDFTAPVPAAQDLGPVHFLAIGGAGMSGVARLFLARGIPVSGSDAQDSATLRQLEAQGAVVHVGHDAAYLPERGTVVVSSAIRETNPELAAARERGLTVLHRAQGIASLLADRDAVAVAGANGKTTTSAMLTVALRAAGADPGFAIGAPIGGIGVNAAPGTGAVFVVEADESDGSFLAYRPQLAVVTNVRPDHLDFYGDLAGVERGYAAFTDTIRPGGVLVACADDPGAVRLADRFRDQRTAPAQGGCRVLTYGTGTARATDALGQPAVPDIVLQDLVGDGLTSRARLLDRPGGTTHELVVPMPGRHNLLNAAGAYAAAVGGLGHDAQAVLAGLAAYPGAHRRFQPVGEVGGVRVVDDYAHNPDKVAAVVAAGRSVRGPGERLVVVFQPHLYSRTRDFVEEFAAGLAGADVVAVMEVYAAREDPLPGVTGELIAERLRTRADFAGAAVWLPDRAGVPAALAELVRPGDLVITVGAGDVTAIGPQLVSLLRSGADPGEAGQ